MLALQGAIGQITKRRTDRGTDRHQKDGHCHAPADDLSGFGHDLPAFIFCRQAANESPSRGYTATMRR